MREVLATEAHEGPVWADGALYFTVGSDIRRLTLDGELSVVVSGLAGPNGMCLGRDGRLLVCEQGDRERCARIAAVDRSTGEVETVVDSWRGRPFNSPNDVVQRSDGTIWFTDPSYGWLQGFRPEPQLGDYVYRYDPSTGDVDAVADGFVKPNGIAFSPDESVLYVTDSGANQEPGSFYVELPHHIEAFEVVDGRLGARRLLAVTMPGFPDGLKTLPDGRVLASAFSGVQVFSPAGELLAEIDLPGAVNFCLGGDDGRLLLITADTAVWAVDLDSLDRSPLHVTGQNPTHR